MKQPIVGSSAPYTAQDVGSISTGRPGQWAYSPCFVRGKLIASTRITLTGYRRNDYVVAEAATRQRHAPRSTVWHHVYDFDGNTDLCTMQLVAWNDHAATIPHTGGCKQYAEKYRRPYRLPAPGEEALPPVCEIPAYSARDLDDFSGRTGLQFTPELRRFYSGAFQLNKKALAYAAQKDFALDAVFPLSDENGADVEKTSQLLKALPSAAPRNGMTPIGVDACGDIFCADGGGAIWFYDHEDGQYYGTDLELRQLME